jgi:hypothetical protein
MSKNVINFFPAKLSSRTAKIFAGRRRDEAFRESLRNRYPSYVVWPDRTDSSRLYLWSAHEVTEKAPNGFTEVTVRLGENPFLFERLLQDAVEGRLRQLGFQRRRYREFVNFFKGNLLDRIEPLSNAIQEPIGIYPKVIIDAFFTASVNEEIVIGIVVDVLYATRLEVPVAEWLAAGVGLDNRDVYVKLLSGTPEAQVHPDLVGLTIGRIAQVKGDWVDLDDLRDRGLHRVGSPSIVPEPRREYLHEYLEARYQQGFARGKQDLAKRFRKLISPKEKHRLIKSLVTERLMKPKRTDLVEPLLLLPGLVASFSDMQAATESADTFRVLPFQRPSYSFDPAGNKTSRRPDEGLQSYGPYSQERTRDQKHRILVVAPAEHKGVVQRAMTKLRQGIKIPGQRQVFTGLGKMYRLPHLQFDEHYFPLSRTAPMKSYGDAIHQALIDIGREDECYDLVLVVIRDDFEQLPDSENPYYQCKGFLLQTTPAIPTQALKIEKLRATDYNLQYILNTVALACYAKMGGTPYVLRTPVGGPTELVFGIGRAVLRKSRFGAGEQTIGFSTVFRANGEYVYNDCTPYCDQDDYAVHLEETVRRTVKQVAGFEQISDGDKLRLIFHVYKRTGKKEIRAIRNAIGKLTRYDIEYALVHVNEDHHFHVFDRECKGCRKGYGERWYFDTSSALLPQRGVSVRLGPRERLITFIGPQQYLGYGCPTPIRITLDKTSTFRDLDYLTQQLFELSFMSARSLTPGIKPVTVLYSEFLADLTGHLRAVQEWTVKLIQQKLNRRLWFI